MRNEIPKQTLMQIEYDWDTIGQIWFRQNFIFPLISHVMKYQTPDCKVVSESSLNSIYNAFETIISGNDIETDVEISVYNVFKDHVLPELKIRVN